MSEVKQVLILDPPSELRFKPPFSVVSTSYINLTNPTDRDVCFKVLTTAPKKYCVRPNAGTIQPKKTVSVAAMLQPHDFDSLAKSSDKFMVRSIYAPEGEYSLDALWNDNRAHSFMNSKVICVFDIPTDSSQVTSTSVSIRQLETERDQLMRELEEEKAVRRNLEENLKKKESELHQGIDRLSFNFQDVLLDEEDSDVTFYVGDQKYPAHKVIMKTVSPVFRAMLKHDMKERNEGVINIPDCDPLMFRDFLSYIYTGKLSVISIKNVFELYNISDKYDVRDLKTKCVDFLSNNLSVDIICDVVYLAAKHFEQTLLSRVSEFFTDNARDILLTVAWQNFVLEHPTEANQLLLQTFNKISGK